MMVWTLTIWLLTQSNSLKDSLEVSFKKMCYLWTTAKLVLNPSLTSSILPCTISHKNHSQELFKVAKISMEPFKMSQLSSKHALKFNQTLFKSNNGLWNSRTQLLWSRQFPRTSYGTQRKSSEMLRMEWKTGTLKNSDQQVKCSVKFFTFSPND